MDALPGLVTDFLDHCRHDRHYSPATCTAYKGDLRLFAAYLETNGAPAQVGEIEREHIAGFLESLRGLKASTKCRKLDCLSIFFKYAVASGCIHRNPVEGVSRPRTETPLPTWVPPEEIWQVERATRGPRERAILLTFVLTGIRKSELIGLDLTDLDRDIATVRVRGKGGKERLLAVPEVLREAIERYLDMRDDTACPALFFNQAGRRLQPASLQRMMKRWLRDAGLVLRCIKAR